MVPLTYLNSEEITLEIVYTFSEEDEYSIQLCKKPDPKIYNLTVGGKQLEHN